MPDNNTCRIPVNATMQKINGEYVMVAAEYADIPAEKIAEFLVERVGAAVIFGGSEDLQEGDSN